MHLLRSPVLQVLLVLHLVLVLYLCCTSTTAMISTTSASIALSLLAPCAGDKPLLFYISWLGKDSHLRKNWNDLETTFFRFNLFGSELATHIYRNQCLSFSSTIPIIISKVGSVLLIAFVRITSRMNMPLLEIDLCNYFLVL